MTDGEMPPIMGKKSGIAWASPRDPAWAALDADGDMPMLAFARRDGRDTVGRRPPPFIIDIA